MARDTIESIGLFGLQVDTTTGEYAIVEYNGSGELVTDGVDLSITRAGVGAITETTYTDNVSYNFQATQVAADDTPDATGYKVLFQDSFSGRMIVWTVDDTGAYVSQQEITNDPAAIRDAEVLFDVDGLDDVDGIGAEVGPTVVVVDDNATGVDLITTDGAYGIVDAANSIDLDLTREGVGTITETTYTDNVSYNFQATQVAADDTPDATGYKVLFQDSFSGRMIVWTVDDTGAYVSQQEITNDPAAIRDAEVLFNVDGLDDVPGIGAEVTPPDPTVVVVDDNATGVDLITTDGAYGIVDAANSIDLDLTREGVGTITDATYTDNVSYNFQATQVAADDTPDATGYKVLFQDSFTGRMIVWTVDDTGAYVSQQEITNDPAAIRDAEVLFNVDGLDDVPGIGAEVGPTVVVVDDNATGVDLITTDGAYGIVDAANSIDLDLTREGVGTITETTYTDNVSYNFQATQVAADDTPDATGYKVLFQDSFTGRMIVWTVDETGAYVSQQEITNDPAAIRDAEVLFDSDVDSDNFQFLENNGAVGLKIDTQTDQYVVETESNEIALTDTGDALIFSESGPIEAEIDDFQVLQLLFEVEAGYETVSVDLLSGAVDQLSATAISELDAESLFDVDLNGDGTIGVIA
ncbi:hypothetical protein [Yoonia litorea]|uniref:Tryptophan-rich Synechocystis species C-terminal domain-containing protein n=1 Tax=Yoonia litorea TaxID=1123755 RepID=A0A1I6MVK4_9RHOB|nr:hypothetical protein [Yoonia litorea]SFS19753.1 Tryptophan-rich Synechocystis species C-terminal domain-containing protein [Yoonia litorea]